MSKKTVQYFSYGDVIDLFHQVKRKGVGFVFKTLAISPKLRTSLKWDKFEHSESDFWVVEQVQKKWNYLCTGSINMQYEEYVAKKYLNQKSNLKMLSVGCGYSEHEVAFYNTNCFDLVEGIDISEQQLYLARKNLAANLTKNIVLNQLNFETDTLTPLSYDLILFNSSLHHFKNIEKIIVEKTIPILKENGLIVIFEYTGPNRLQWTHEQLTKANQLLNQIPKHLKTIYNSHFTKKRVYRPGLIRTLVSDPSEAKDSESILDILNKYLDPLEEKKLGGNILHPLLKGIAHHFISNTPETNAILENLISEDISFAMHTKSDFTFGVYRKKKPQTQ